MHCDTGSLAGLGSPGEAPSARFGAPAIFADVMILQPAGSLGRIARSARRVCAGALTLSVALTLTACKHGSSSSAPSDSAASSASSAQPSAAGDSGATATPAASAGAPAAAAAPNNPFPTASPFPEGDKGAARNAGDHGQRDHVRQGTDDREG